MKNSYEIWSRFEEAVHADEVLYSPIGGNVTCRQSRVYTFEWSGEEERALEEFAERCLLDPVSQQFEKETSERKGAWDGSIFVLEYGLKRTVLDLEKEAILSFYRGLNAPAFRLLSLAIRHRVYLFGEDQENLREVFVRDLVNPAIHDHEIMEACEAAS
ncbi:MAG: hypothetical protein AAGJ31_02305 [Verrucomicrobiota bacterium]